jgi:hypothetical protein
MDVNIITNVPYSIPRFGENGELIPGRIIGEKKPELPYPLSNQDSEAAKIREQMVMNLEQVQNFLFMLIGSKIRIHSESNSVGSIINTAV